MLLVSGDADLAHVQYDGELFGGLG